jgi:hypothetical protein
LPCPGCLANVFQQPAKSQSDADQPVFPARRFTTAQGLAKPGSILIPTACFENQNGFRLAPE